MTSSEHDRKIRQLAAAFIDGRLDEASREELNFLLRDDAANRVAFLSMVDLQCEMMRLLSSDELADGSSAAAEAPAADLLDVATPDALHGSPIERSKWRAGTGRSKSNDLLRNRSLPWALTVLSTAACLFMAVGYRSFWSDAAPPSPPVAASSVRVGQATATEFFDDTPKAAGEMLNWDHEYVMTSGVVSLDFPCGAEAILESPCVFRLLAEDHLLVSLGKCSLHAPEGAEGFRIDTPQAELIDLGTRFCVDVNEAGQTDVHVVEGAASVTPKLDSRAIAAGDSVTATKADRPNILTVGRAQRIGFDLPDAVTPIRYRRSSYRSVLPDRVLDYDCEITGGRGGELRSVRIQRGGRTYTYSAEDLIGIRLIHFVPQRPSHNVAATPQVATPLRDLLETDHNLSTGIINPGGNRRPLLESPSLVNDSQLAIEAKPADELSSAEYGQANTSGVTPGLGFLFEKPVVNDRGPDLVLFELQSKVDPPTGDSFHISPLHFEGSRRSHSINRYDITMRSPLAKMSHVFSMPQFEPSVNLLAASTTDATYEHPPALDFYILAVGVDLSDLGYADGERADGLFIQDDLLDRNLIDPVLIGGLPSLSETTP